MSSGVRDGSLPRMLRCLRYHLHSPPAELDDASVRCQTSNIALNRERTLQSQLLLLVTAGKNSWAANTLSDPLLFDVRTDHGPFLRANSGKGVFLENLLLGRLVLCIKPLSCQTMGRCKMKRATRVVASRVT